MKFLGFLPLCLLPLSKEWIFYYFYTRKTVGTRFIPAFHLGWRVFKMGLSDCIFIRTFVLLIVFKFRMVTYFMEDNSKLGVMSQFLIEIKMYKKFFRSHFITLMKFQWVDHLPNLFRSIGMIWKNILFQSHRSPSDLIKLCLGSYIYVLEDSRGIGGPMYVDKI